MKQSSQSDSPIQKRPVGAPLGSTNHKNLYPRLLLNIKSAILEKVHPVLDLPDRPATEEEIKEDMLKVLTDHYEKRAKISTYQPFIKEILHLVKEVGKIRLEGYGNYTDKYDAPILFKFNREVEAFCHASTKQVDRVDLIIRLAILVYYLVQIYAQDYDEAAFNEILVFYCNRTNITPQEALHACIEIMQCHVDHPGLKGSDPEESHRLERQVIQAILNESWK